MQNRLVYKTFTDIVMFCVNVLAIMMTVSSVERVLLEKLFYENWRTVSAAVREFRLIKNL